MELMLYARQPFLLSSVIYSHGWAGLAPFSRRDDGLSYVMQLESGRVVELFIIEVDGNVSLQLNEKLSQQELDEVSANAGWMLDLEADFGELYALAREEPRLAKVVPLAQGRLLRSPSFFEDVVKTILTTNTAWGGTVRMAERLASQFGSPLPQDPERKSFPTAVRIASQEEETLREETGLGYRAPYILELAQSTASGELDLESFKSAEEPSEVLRKKLLAIKGVGEYSAAHLLMLLGRYDYVPVDTWTKKMVSQEWYGGEEIGQKEVDLVFDKWGKWKGLVYWLWDWEDAAA